MVSVADTGSGIPPAILDKVFNPFFTTKEVGKGSGLGLSLVLGVAQKLGGGVRIETTPGPGTTVKVYLPRASAAAGQRDREPRPAPPPPVTGIGRAATAAFCWSMTIPMSARSPPRCSPKPAIEVVEADSGGAALALLDDPDLGVALLIADIVMPGMNGVELAHAVRRRRPEMPVLFVTGYGGTALPANQPTPGELLRKPFRAAELRAKVPGCCGSRQHRPARPSGLRGLAAPESRRAGVQARKRRNAASTISVGDDVAAGEFAVIDVVAERTQPHRDAPAAALDRQHRILPAVADEDRRRVLGSRRQRETGRERDDVAEQTAIDQPERQRIGRAVGKTGDRDMRRGRSCRFGTPRRARGRGMRHPRRNPGGSRPR